MFVIGKKNNNKRLKGQLTYLPCFRDGKMPVNRVGLLSYMFVSWFSPLVWKLYKSRDRPVAESDIWACSDEEGFEMNTDR